MTHEEAFELRLQLMGLKGKQSSGVTGGKPWATRSGGESGRLKGGAVQGSATAVSGRVPYFSDTKLDCGRLSVESERVEEKRASKIVQHRIPHYPFIPARFVSSEQNRDARILSLLVLINVPRLGMLFKRAVMRAPPLQLASRSNFVYQVISLMT